MSLDKDWETIRSDRYSRAADAGMGMLRITLLFGSAAVAIALLATSYLDDPSRSQFARNGYGAGLDMTATGSVSRQSTYVIRRSVLQPSPESVCVIRTDGRRSGDC